MMITIMLTTQDTDWFQLFMFSLDLRKIYRNYLIFRTFGIGHHVHQMYIVNHDFREMKSRAEIPGLTSSLI